MNSKQKGDLGSSAALNWFISQGYEVLMPFGDRRPYDLVIEKDGKFRRVQCKYISEKCKTMKVYKCKLATHNPNTKTRTFYKEKDFDFLWAHTPSGSWLIPVSALMGAKKMKTDAVLGLKYQKYKVT